MLCRLACISRCCMVLSLVIAAEQPDTLPFSSGLDYVGQFDTIVRHRVYEHKDVTVDIR